MKELPIYIENNDYKNGVSITVHISKGALKGYRLELLKQNLEIALLKSCKIVDDKLIGID